MSISSPLDSHSNISRHFPPTEGGPAVMVVEDEACVSLFIEQALIGLGYRVSSYSSAESALEVLPSRLPRLILTDCRLGGMSGIQFIEKARQLYPDISIIAMSGEHVNGAAMLEAGAILFLEKPLSVECIAKAFPNMLTLGVDN